MEVCTNYRFQRRNDPKFKVAVDDDKKDNEQSQMEADKIAESKKKSKVVAKRPKKGEKKDPHAELAAKKAAEEADLERKKKELETERKRADLAARESYKPKDYTEDEKLAHAAYAEEMSTFFGELIARQKAGLTKKQAEAQRNEASVRDS